MPYSKPIVNDWNNTWSGNTNEDVIHSVCIGKCPQSRLLRNGKFGLFDGYLSAYDSWFGLRCYRSLVVALFSLLRKRARLHFIHIQSRQLSTFRLFFLEFTIWVFFMATYSMVKAIDSHFFIHFCLFIRYRVKKI